MHAFLALERIVPVLAICSTHSHLGNRTIVKVQMKWPWKIYADKYTRGPF